MSQIKFGITGSIACGKSAVTRIIRKQGIPVVDADIVAREVVVPGSQGLDELVSAFGPEYLQEDGTLDRPKLATLVFENAEELKIINHIMDPLIHKECCRQLKVLEDEGHDLIGFDAALIIERGQVEYYRPLIVVACPLDLQLTRLMTRNTLTREVALARIDKQLSSVEKAKYADYLIESTGTLEELEVNTLSVIESIRNTHALKSA